MIDSDITCPAGRAARLTVILLMCFLALGCAKTVKSLGELSRLHAAIVTEFGEQEVGVNLNNDTALTITFINSPLNERSLEERAQRAGQTAKFVTQHYVSMAQISEIWVVFMRSETHFIFVHTSQTVGVFGFDRVGEPISTPQESPRTSAPDRSMRATAVYSSTTDQTEVAISGLQLQGDSNQGLTASSHFTVPGDATGVRRSSSYPRMVTFEFVSYSEKSLFPGEPKIKLLADEKVVFEKAEQFATSKNQDGLFTEIVKLEVPYAAFRRLITGKKLRLVLGDYEYKLTDQQAEALREMTQYVKE